MDFKKEVIKLLEKEVKGIDINLEVPMNKEFGDYAFPCFSLAGKFRNSPVNIAKELAEKLEVTKYIKKIEAKGSYINFFINNEIQSKNIIEEIVKKKEAYGRTLNKKKILLEHTSINPNASPHVGRARNALIGDSVKRILEFGGYKPEVHYFVNDVGKQIAMLVYGAKKNVSFDGLLKEYIKINVRVEKNPKLIKEILELLYQLENGNKKVRSRFRAIVDTCIKGQTNILNDLGIKYDKFDYESDYLWDKKVNAVLNHLKKTGKLFRDEFGRAVLNEDGHNLAMKSPVLVLTRNDNTSLYPLRDIAYTLEKMKKGENIIVLGEEQKLYFEQLKIALELMGVKSPRLLSYSYILLSEGKMSTRQGNVVLLEEFMKQAKDKANEEIFKRYKKKDGKLAKIIGYGALKYSILKIDHNKNVIFDWERALDFEGESSPYIQYSYVRAKSILKKLKIDKKVDFGLLNQNEEINLINNLARFKEVFEKSLEDLKPYLIANYTYELAKSFNEFYNNCDCIHVEKRLCNTRLTLVLAFSYVIKNCLWLLGIGVPEKM